MLRKRLTGAVADRFWLLGLALLLLGLLFGLVGVLQYVFPSWGRDTFSFARTRPLHVFMAVQWVYCGGIGGVYSWLERSTAWRSRPVLHRWGSAHFALHLLCTLLIAAVLLSGHFGGREYLEFPPVLGIGYFCSWVLFAFIFFRSVGRPSDWPVYGWMFATGIIAFLVSYLEAFAWLLPWVGDTVVRDLTVQWKSLGALVGSWNMLVYGTGFLVMERIDGNIARGFRRQAFLVYLLGFTNLLFNWGHHIYSVPVSSVLRNVAYAVSMTELILLARILWNFRQETRQAFSDWHFPARRWLYAADVWVMLNLVLAILISVPWINRFTHGTHVTVAHAMGATIGINTNLLFAALVHRLSVVPSTQQEHGKKQYGCLLFQWTLFVFWSSLLCMGVVRMNAALRGASFPVLSERLTPWYWFFGTSGALLAGLLIWQAVSLWSRFLPACSGSQTTGEVQVSASGNRG
jgi:nitric oxide reductase subunit B